MDISEAIHLVRLQICQSEQHFLPSIGPDQPDQPPICSSSGQLQSFLLFDYQARQLDKVLHSFRIKQSGVLPGTDHNRDQYHLRAGVQLFWTNLQSILLSICAGHLS